MENRCRMAATLLGLSMLTAQASEPDGFAHLHGFGEGVAAVLSTSTPAADSRRVQDVDGKVLLKTYRQPGIELTTMSSGGRTFPASLAISRAGYALPLGLRIGDLRGEVERTLGALERAGTTLILTRQEGEGCDDPIVLTFRGKVLAQVAWTWQTCMD